LKYFFLWCLKALWNIFSSIWNIFSSIWNKVIRQYSITEFDGRSAKHTFKMGKNYTELTYQQRLPVSDSGREHLQHLENLYRLKLTHHSLYNIDIITNMDLPEIQRHNHKYTRDRNFAVLVIMAREIVCLSKPNKPGFLQIVLTLAAGDRSMAGNVLAYLCKQNRNCVNN
jgi:hypothetical protein